MHWIGAIVFSLVGSSLATILSLLISGFRDHRSYFLKASWDVLPVACPYVCISSTLAVCGWAGVWRGAPTHDVGTTCAFACALGVLAAAGIWIFDFTAFWSEDPERQGSLARWLESRSASLILAFRFACQRHLDMDAVDCLEGTGVWRLTDPKSRSRITKDRHQRLINMVYEDYKFSIARERRLDHLLDETFSAPKVFALLKHLGPRKLQGEVLKKAAIKKPKWNGRERRRKNGGSRKDRNSAKARANPEVRIGDDPDRRERIRQGTSRLH